MVQTFDNSGAGIYITPYTKNETWKYTGAEKNVVFNIGVDDWIGGQYNNNNWRSFATKAKNGKDLTVTTVFYDIIKNTPKLVTTTIKDFFTEGVFEWVKIPNKDLNLASSTTVLSNDNSTYYTASEDDSDFTTDADFILGSDAKSANLSLHNGGGDTVYDLKGADNYTMQSDYSENGKADAIYDFDGNDSYVASNKNTSQVKDFKGNDIYNSRGAGTLLSVHDYAGNDEYQIYSNGSYSGADYKGNDLYCVDDTGDIYANDYAGNDTYEKMAINSNAGGATSINDTAGNDNYDFEAFNNHIINGAMRVFDSVGNDKFYLSGVQLASQINDTPNMITEVAGNDTYGIVNSKGFYIHDGAGNDKWSLSNSTGLNSTLWQQNLYVEDDAGNDTYELNTVKFATSNTTNLWDKKGNDKYSFNDVENYYVKDDEGNDSYSITASFNVDIYDNNDGNDKYVITNCNSVADVDIDIIDDSGNDSYKIVNSTGINLRDESFGDKKSNDKYEVTAGSDEIDIEDYSGNETYNIKGSYDKKTDTISWVGKVEIEDDDGNDTYNLQYVDGYLKGGTDDTEIEDDEGTDKYNVVSSKHIYIEDYGYTGDTYNVSGVKTDDVWIIDSDGNDKYTVKGTKGNYLKNVGIDDSGYNYYYDNGSKHYTSDDTYNIEYLINEDDDDWYIWDEGGNNTFNIKNSRLEVNFGEDYNYDKDDDDIPGKDKINITNCSLNDGLGVVVNDVYGYSEGTYNIKGSSCTITDKGCNDKYTISALGNNRIIVEDYSSGYSSENDSMTISGIAKKDLIYMTNFKKTGNFSDDSNSLMVYDSKNKGFVKIQGYFDKEGSDYVDDNHGYGFIEELKVDKKITDGDVYITNWVTKFNEIRAEVGAWLATNNYTDVVDVITNEHQEGDLAALTAYFVPNNQ